MAWDGENVTLTTENGQGPTNTIILEPRIQVKFVEVLEEIADGKRKP